MSIKNRKLQVFVSSTFLDLKEERQAAVEAILKTRNIPAGMELFAAGDQSQMEVIQEWIRESDVYLLILGGRYGSIEPISGKSYTQLEFEYAIEQQKPLFSIVITEEALDRKVKNGGTSMVETDNGQLLKDFKALVTSRMVSFWDDLKDIKLAIHESLADIERKEGLVGWVKGDQDIDSGALAEEMARLGKENADLRIENERLKALELDILDSPAFEELFSIIKSKVLSSGDLRDYYFINERQMPVLENNKINGNDLLWDIKENINGVYTTPPEQLGGFFNFLYHNQIIKFVNSPDKRKSTSAEFTSLGRKYLRHLQKVKGF